MTNDINVESAIATVEQLSQATGDSSGQGGAPSATAETVSTPAGPTVSACPQSTATNKQRKRKMEKTTAHPISQLVRDEVDESYTGDDLPRQRSAASTINITDADPLEITELAWQALQRTNVPPTLFTQAEHLCRIQRDSDGVPFIRPLDSSRLRYHLGRAADFTDKGKMIRPPDDLMRDMLACPNPPLPPLRHLVYAPYVTRTGQLHLTPGYHPDSQLWYEPNGNLVLPTIPPNPTRDEIANAVRVLMEPLVDFPLVGEASRAHAIALQLVPYFKELVGAIPAIAINKPTRGTGGGLLCDVLLLPSQGGEPAKMTEAGDESEWRRVILGKLLTGWPVIIIDNVREILESAALASAITEAFIEDRIIRTSQVIRVPGQRIWVFVGNNLLLSDEISRRTIWIDLDAGLEFPEYRQEFRYPHLRAWVIAHRSELVHAAFTLYSAWVAAGRPRGRRTLGSFEAFCEVMGGILDVADIPGFLEGHASRQTGDIQQVAFKAAMRLMYQRSGSTEFGVADLLTLLQGSPDLMPALRLGDKGQDSQRTNLGLRLATRRGQVFGGLKLTLLGNVQGANRWKLVPMGGSA